MGANLGLMWATLQVRGVLRDIDTIQHGAGGQGSGGYEGIVQGATYILQWRDGCLQASLLSIGGESAAGPDPEVLRIGC